MDKEQIAAPEEIPSELLENSDSESEGHTIKAPVCLNKESSQQYNNIKTLLIKNSNKTKDYVDTEVLKELNKHNFKSVSDFYEFLESAKLKGLVKVMPASKNYSENHESVRSESRGSSELKIQETVESKQKAKREFAVLEIEATVELENQEPMEKLLEKRVQPLKSAQDIKTQPTIIENIANPLNNINKAISMDSPEDNIFAPKEVDKEINGNGIENEEKINEIQSKEDCIKQNDKTTSYLNNKTNIEPLNSTDRREFEESRNKLLKINKDTPVASPSQIPDPSEFLKRKPIIVDYSKIVCDGTSRFYDDESNDCVDIPPFQISSNFSTPQNSEPIEFSNSPKFMSDAQELEECLIEKNTEESNMLTTKVTFLSDNSNFYSSQMINKKEHSKIQTTECDDESSKSKDLTYNVIVDPDIFKELNECSSDNESKINNLLESLDPDKNTRLPLKKRRLSVSVKLQEILQDSQKGEISFPATPMISIAEVEALQNKCSFKTLAERKHFPHLLETTTNGTFTKHDVAAYMPVDYIPCPSYYTVPPYNNVPTYEEKSNGVLQNKCSRRNKNRTRRTPEKKERKN